MTISSPWYAEPGGLLIGIAGVAVLYWIVNILPHQAQQASRWLLLVHRRGRAYRHKHPLFPPDPRPDRSRIISRF